MLLSTGANGARNGDSWAASIGPDGHTVAFDSLAGNLLAGDSNGRGDVAVVPISGGQYLVEITARGAGGAQSRAIAPLHLSRQDHRRATKAGALP